jgi:hypothetical protein
MMIALWQFDKEDLLAGLLLFRLLYYIIPFLISLTILAFREFVLRRTGSRSASPAHAPLNAIGQPVRPQSELPR